MNWLTELFSNHESIARTVLILSAVVASGLSIGSVRVAGISLGIAGVLFTGLGFGHFGLTIDAHILEFAREFGLALCLVDRRVRGRIDDHVGTQRTHGGSHAFRIRKIATVLGAVEVKRRDLPQHAQAALQLPSDLTALAQQKNVHDYALS